MTLADVQRRLGVAPDGRWGPATEAAFMRVLGTADSPEPTGLHPRALALIKEFEGFEAKAYRDAVGVWTIGYGTTAAAGVGIDPKAGMEISETEAEMYLNRAIDKFADQIFPLMTRTPTAEQFGAMLSLAYNIGPRAFAGSTVLKRFNAGDIQNAADAFLMWNKAGGEVLRGLTRRREAERELFLS